MIELTLLVPWFLFLFVFTIDMGFFNYSMISVENAARIAAEYTSQSSSTAADSTDACTLVLNELAPLPNVGTSVTSCSALPVIVTASSVNPGVDGSPATSVTVTYQTKQMIPIPGYLMGQLTLNRTVQMRVNQ